MSDPTQLIIAEVKSLIEKGLAAGDLMSTAQMEEHLARFRERFGPAVLRALDGEALLNLMHGRQDSESRCLAYWLEFKNDDEFAGYRFGGIGGGSALKYGLFQRKSDGAWVTGLPKSMRVMSRDEAITVARRQRDQLVAGSDTLSACQKRDRSDATYAALQAAMEWVAPDLSGAGWAHKYWFLLHSNLLDDYHSPHYQRFHLIKLLQTPPDKEGVLKARTARFVCAGRLVTLANSLNVHVSTLTKVLNQRNGAFHRYWRIGTTEGPDGENHWAAMREGNFASLVRSAQVPDLTPVIALPVAVGKRELRQYFTHVSKGNRETASREASEALNFAQAMAEDDVVLACEGQNVWGIGRVRGPYEFKKDLPCPHTRAVQWLTLQPWKLPDSEAERTTAFAEMGAANDLLEIERMGFESRRRITKPVSAAPRVERRPMSPLDSLTARIDGILKRKGQVILYGPPGTGKTHRALHAAWELASRQGFQTDFAALRGSERDQIVGANGLVQLCTFHPGYSYEDFVEGLRPRTTPSGQLSFEPRDGIFKDLCSRARGSTRPHFLVIDEINRGDVARIFGELLTVIEQDKRAIPVTLSITKEQFVVPDNVFILGTMNTADRSISLLDAALRRRFGFIELMPDSALLAGRKAGTLPLGPWLEALNTRLRSHLKRDARNLQIGHAYLMQPITSVAEFARVLRDDIIPLIEEYCYDDFQMLKEILGGDIVDVEAARIREDIFAPHREDDLIQAIRFEEMEALALGENVLDDDSTLYEEDEEWESVEGEGRGD